MSEPNREAVEAAALAIAEVWTSENKKVDIKQAAALFEPSATGALTAALPHLIAAKDAEIAALRAALGRLSTGVCFHHSSWGLPHAEETIARMDFACAALEMSGGVK